MFDTMTLETLGDIPPFEDEISSHVEDEWQEVVTQDLTRAAEILDQLEALGIGDRGLLAGGCGKFVIRWREHSGRSGDSDVWNEA
jgi:hypothetical protein